MEDNLIMDGVSAVDVTGLDSNKFKNVNSKLLQMKMTSYKNTQKKWEASIKRLRTNMNKVKEEVVNSELELGENKDLDTFTELVAEKARKIANMEAQLKVYEGQSVPIRYVDDRALKLLEKMYSVLEPTVHSSVLYAVPEEKQEDVFTEEIMEEAREFPGDITENSIEEEKELTLDDTKDIVGGMLDEIELDLDTDKKEKIEEDSNVIDDEIIPDEVVDEVTVDEPIEEVSERYSYKPMTDEEISEAQNRISLEEEEYVSPLPEIKFENKFKPAVGVVTEDIEEPIRELPVVAKDRDEFDLEKDLNFDYSNVTKSDVDNIVENESTTPDMLASLKEVLAMKDELRASEKAEQDAKLAADEAEEQRNVVVKRSEEVEGARLESDKILQEQLEETRRQLQERMDAVNKNIQFEEERKQTALDEISNSKSSIEENEAKIRENEQMQKELSTVVEVGTVNVRRR